MKTITAIEAQKHHAHRFNVYLNGEYAFPVSEQVLVDFTLHKGQELDTTQIEQITAADTTSRAYSQALDYLSHQLRTTQEVQTALRKRTVPPEIIETVCARLKDQHLLDDQEYANSYVRTVARTELKGPRIIRQKLRQRGITATEIDQALLQFPPKQRVANAYTLAQKLTRRYHNKPIRLRQTKVNQGLMTAGFERDTITQALAQFSPEVDEEHEAVLLQAAAAKVWRRYDRFDQHTRMQKAKQALYRQGFPLDESTFALEDLAAKEEE
ncbi:recombination regulator RecX [Ligilactobacillus sp. LYQ112]|uniref:recombination regulator RecX n=1 Tax=Ligilactobacillus sp. LYQ112 TaxID=3391060 RepID=UPI0039832A6A